MLLGSLSQTMPIMGLCKKLNSLKITIIWGTWTLKLMSSLRTSLKNRCDAFNSFIKDNFEYFYETNFSKGKSALGILNLFRLSMCINIICLWLNICRKSGKFWLSVMPSYSVGIIHKVFFRKHWINWPMTKVSYS